MEIQARMDTSHAAARAVHVALRQRKKKKTTAIFNRSANVRSIKVRGHWSQLLFARKNENIVLILTDRLILTPSLSQGSIAFRIFLKFPSIVISSYASNLDLRSWNIPGEIQVFPREERSLSESSHVEVTSDIGVAARQSASRERKARSQ